VKLSEVLKRNYQGLMIDGEHYEVEQIQFTQDELDIEMEVLVVYEPLKIRTKIAQGIIDGHVVMGRVI
jgi:hypothetical protein